jgi:hypothetical protein
VSGIPLCHRSDAEMRKEGLKKRLNGPEVAQHRLRRRASMTVAARWSDQG